MYLLSSGVVSSRDKCTSKYSPLELSVKQQNLEITSILIKNGFALSYQCKLKQSPNPPSLSSSSSSKPRSQNNHRRISSKPAAPPIIMKRPLFAPTRLQLRGKSNPLHWAAYLGNLRLCCMLMVAGIDPCTVDECGNLPLHLAATACLEDPEHQTVVEILSHCSPTDQRNLFGNTPTQLTTDKTVKTLLQKPQCDLMSLEKLHFAEEELEKALRHIHCELESEKLKYDAGFTVFGDEDTIMVFIEDPTESADERESRKLRWKQDIEKKTRTRKLSLAIQQFTPLVGQLSASVMLARERYVEADKVIAGETLLHKLRSRLEFESASLNVLESLEDLQKLEVLKECCNRKEQVPAFIQENATKVLKHAETWMMLNGVYLNLKTLLKTREIEEQQINELEMALMNFIQYRIDFMKTSKQLQNPEAKPFAEQITETKSISITEAPKTKNKKRSKTSKKSKKQIENQVEEQTAIVPEQEAEMNSEVVDTSLLSYEDADDVLLHESSALLLKLKRETQFRHHLSQDCTVGTKQGTLSRIAVVENALKSLNSLLNQCSMLVGLVVDEELVQQSQARMIQLQKDLNKAKRLYSEKQKNSRK